MNSKKNKKHESTKMSDELKKPVEVVIKKSVSSGSDDQTDEAAESEDPYL